jgi:hypothetical protein
MKSNSFSRKARTLRRAAGISLLLLPACFGQGPRLTVSDPGHLTVKRGSAATLKLAASLNEGFHANSHTPSDENLIPLTLTWTPGPVVAKDVIYPKPQMEKYSFSEKPISVVSGAFDLTTKFAAAPGATTGDSVVVGKLKYQACNDKACFPPKTVEVKVPVTVN